MSLIIEMSYFVDKINANETFSASRFNDGEFLCILGEQGHNCDKHQYFPQMKLELKNIVESRPEYLMGFGSGPVNAHRKQEILDYSSKFKWDFDADLFMFANRDGEFNSFIRAIRNKKVLFIGNSRIRIIGSILGIELWDFLEIPIRDCYTQINDIEKSVFTVCKEKKIDLILFSCGMATNCLIHRLYSRIKDTTMMDIGSVWEPYLGIKIRSYHLQDDWDVNRIKNLR